MLEKNRNDSYKKKKVDKNNRFDEDRQIQHKANKQFKHKKLELYDEDSLKEIENYK